MPNQPPPIPRKGMLAFHVDKTGSHPFSSMGSGLVPGCGSLKVRDWMNRGIARRMCNRSRLAINWKRKTSGKDHPKRDGGRTVSRRVSAAW
jgi:hypothetical protein